VSRENVELVKRGYEAWNAGDTDGILEALSPDVEWRGHSQLPEPGPVHGREAVGEWIQRLTEVWSELFAEPVEFVDFGDSVIVLVRMSGRGRGSGVEVHGGLDVHAWSLDGGRVTRFRMYQGDDAAERVALSELERNVVRLCVAGDLGDGEVAARLDTPEDEVEMIRARAIGKLGALAEGSTPT
jgi:ketosteroid isomerase-like protein